MTATMAPPSLVPVDTEERYLLDLKCKICEYVQHQDRAQPCVLPLRHSQIELSPIEANAFRGGYAGEDSFRGSFNHAFVEMVCLRGRIQEEMERFRAKRDSTYLWQAYAKALQTLAELAQPALEHSAAVLKIARERGLTEKSESLESAENMVKELLKAISQVPPFSVYSVEES
jgi:vacuolar-type H+-ATPase subunit H